MKKSSKIFIMFGVAILILFLLVITISFVVKNKERKALVDSIRSSFSTYSVLKKDSDIYIKENDTYKKIGTGSIGTVFKLSDMEINSVDDKYFNIAFSNYYVYYEDVKPIEKRIENDRYNLYIDFDYNIVTDEVFSMYMGDKKIVEINESLSLPIRYKDEGDYYTVFNEMLVKISNDDVREIVENINSDIKETNKISVLNYAEVKEDCADDRCITKKQFEEHIKYLNDNGFITITLEEYDAWLKGDKRLPEKSIFLVIDNTSEYIEKIAAEKKILINTLANSDIRLFLYNIVSTRESKRSAVHSYRVLSSTDMDDFKKMVAGETLATETASSRATSIAVLNYHFLFDSSKGETCYPSICLEEKEFRKQLQYLHDNGFKTITMEEFRAWMYGEIELPKKTVLLTFDDGYVGNLIPIMEEFDMQATIFSVTAWHDKEKFMSDNISIESHGHDIHHEGFCKGVNRGAKALCISREELLQDLRTSIERLDSNIAFCYPFWVVNNYLKEVVTEAGFQLGFGVGYNKATRKSDKYNIPRYVIYNRTSFNEFIGMVN